LKSIHALPLLLLILCGTTFALAQSTDASISGVVVDPSGKVIPAADIELLNEATGVPYSSKSERFCNSVNPFAIDKTCPDVGAHGVHAEKLISIDVENDRAIVVNNGSKMSVRGGHVFCLLLKYPPALEGRVAFLASQPASSDFFASSEHCPATPLKCSESNWFLVLPRWAR
jgi:hypothetical protein